MISLDLTLLNRNLILLSFYDRIINIIEDSGKENLRKSYVGDYNIPSKSLSLCPL